MKRKNDLLDLSRSVVRRATKLGAQGTRVQLERVRNSSVEWRDGQLDRLRETTEQKLTATLFVDGRYAVNVTSDLRPEALDAFLAESVAGARLLTPDPYRKLPDPDRFAAMYAGDLGQYDPDGSEAVTPVGRRRLARELEEAARSAPGADAIASVSTTASDILGEDVIVTSNGMEGTSRSTVFVTSAVAAVRDGEERKQRGYWRSVVLFRDRLAPAAEVGREATRRALQAVGARPLPTGEYDCVIENMVAGRLLGHLQEALAGNAIQQGRSFLGSRQGEEIASPVLTLRDEPHLFGGFGSSAYDIEGMATRPRAIIERGVLRNFYLSVYYAGKLGLEPTTASPSNLVIPQGERDLDGLLAAMGNGILVTSFVGGNSNGATGDFSVGIKGLRIENGRPAEAVSEMNLSGNQIDFWKRLVEVGADPNLMSSYRTPSLRFRAVQFSGA